MCIATIMHGTETWNMGLVDRIRVDVLEMKYFRSMAGLTRIDRVRNVEVRRRVGMKRELART